MWRGVQATRKLRMPPKIKVLEAASALAAGRVEKLGSRVYRVRSSDGSRVYLVYVDPERGVAYSNDNGTRLRGYIGYPIIAALMDMGLVPYDPRVGEALRDVAWRRLNERYKKYALVLREVERIAASRGVAPEKLRGYMEEAWRSLARLTLYALPNPPLELAGRDE